MGTPAAAGQGFVLAEDLPRAGAGGGSAVFGWLGASAGAFCGPLAVACVPAGAVLGGVVWSEIFQPLIFQAPFLQPADRELGPLNF